MNELEQKLLSYFRQLSQSDSHALLRFAGYLASGQQADTKHEPQTEVEAVPAGPAEIPCPQLTERPENERVVDALKRLSNAYPMLEKKILLDKASGIVAQHVMFGKPAKVVIDEIENLFADAYAEFVRKLEGK